MRTYTPLDLITRAMRLIGSLASGETPSGAEATDGLDVANGMLDTWQAERLMIFSTQRVVNDSNNVPLTLVAGQQTYSLGTGGDFDIPRPARIDNYSVINIANISQPLELPIQELTDYEWQNVPTKNIQSALPVSVWNDGNYPLMNLWYWPIPNTQVLVALYLWQALQEFADLTTEYTFPPAYYECLVYNLADRFIAEYPGNYAQEVLATVPRKALEMKAVVKSFNAPIDKLYCDDAIVGRGGFWNYRTGAFQRIGGGGG